MEQSAVITAETLQSKQITHAYFPGEFHFKKQPRHSFYLQTRSQPDLQIFGSVRDLRKAVSKLDQSDIIRVVKGYEKKLRVETRILV